MSRTPDEARRAELLDAAVDYVCRHGLTGLSLRPLAKALETSPRNLLYHFGSKDDLVVEIIRRGRARQQTTMANLKLSGDLPPSQVSRILWRQWSDPKRLPLMRLFFEVYHLALAEPARFPGFSERAVEEWLGALEGCSTLPSYSRADARAFATVLIAAFRGFMLDLIATGDRARIDRAVEVYLAMLDNAVLAATSPGEDHDATA
ncbi:MAG: TetR/AcrR family transcriptional regulator [Candidatus Eremiobacteraeota bacterium]|nr:TetR/AcrR family transcriptional regulator [Candidatus Eremiobacteraeota bacterium]MBV8721343.1 TetR/AcrR family transcriptional regulator [Candidatus Eremiobacteraeota bacterium]